MMPPSAESIQIILPIISIFFLLLTFSNPVYGAISYLIIMDAKLGAMYPVLGALRFELFAAVIVLLSILANGKGLQNIKANTNSLNKPLWILATVGMLSVPQAVDVSFSWTFGGYNLFKLLLFYIMVVASLQTRRDFEKMLWAIVLISAWTAYEPVVNYLAGIGAEHGYGQVALGRFGSASGHVALANTLLQALPLTFCLALAMRGRKLILELVVWACVPLLVLGIIFSKSRGGFIGLVACGGCYVIFSRNRLRSAVIVVIALICLLPFAGQQYLERISTISHGISGRSSTDRYLGLVNGISMMTKRPILGVGIGCYPRAREIYFRYFFYSHNLYGELLGELGVASMAWFYWIYAVFRRAGSLKIRFSVVEQQRMYMLVMTGIQSSLLVRLVLGNFSHSAFIWFWFMMAALVVGAENINRESLLSEQPIKG
jgi:hypothetical protein